MEIAQFHRAYWHYASNSGIAKLHCESLSIVGFIFECGVPRTDIDFLSSDEVSYCRQVYKKSGRPLTLGVQIDRDKDLIRVVKDEESFVFPEINLAIKIFKKNRYFRHLQGEWIKFRNDSVIEYQRCDSLICVNQNGKTNQTILRV